MGRFRSADTLYVDIDRPLSLEDIADALHEAKPGVLQGLVEFLQVGIDPVAEVGVVSEFGSQSTVSPCLGFSQTKVYRT